jgi:hypothetical protein
MGIRPVPRSTSITAIVAGMLAFASPPGLFGQTVNSPVRQVSSNSQAAARIPLEIYNFTIAGPVDDPQWAEGLQMAVSDSLLLQFLGQSGIDSRRIREAYRPAAISVGTKSSANSQNPVRVSEGRVRYVLEGRL